MFPVAVYSYNGYLCSGFVKKLYFFDHVNNRKS